jgi:TRAP-type C4-dicarboxylate transport system permease large subunit
VLFVHALLGHLRSGLLHVMVLSMYLVSGLSGSKTADVAAVGSVMRDMLKKEGYHAGEGAAVLAASAAMGETVPPTIAMLVLGSITTLSMATLFIGGIIPAAVVAACLMR